MLQLTCLQYSQTHQGTIPQIAKPRYVTLSFPASLEQHLKIITLVWNYQTTIHLSIEKHHPLSPYHSLGLCPAICQVSLSIRVGSVRENRNTTYSCPDFHHPQHLGMTKDDRHSTLPVHQVSGPRRAGQPGLQHWAPGGTAHDGRLGSWLHHHQGQVLHRPPETPFVWQHMDQWQSLCHRLIVKNTWDRTVKHLSSWRYAGGSVPWLYFYLNCVFIIFEMCVLLSSV